MRALASAGAGFLLAVLWFDLMFDIQARGHRAAELPESVLASIAAYYARVTTAARPMNRLVGIAMLVTLGSLIAELYSDEIPVWRTTASLALTFAAVALAAGHTVPSAIRLSTRRDDDATQSRLARTVLRDHVLCIVAVAGVLLLQLLPA